MGKRKALVTGATGGLGRTLVPSLIAADYDVTATGRNLVVGEELAASGATFVAADLLSDPLESLVADIDVVFHLAALSSPWGKPSRFAALNLHVTERLLAVARNARCDTFIYASTPSIYAEPRDRLGLTESSPPAHSFANEYAATKHAAESRVLAANTDDFKTVVIRPRAIVGPNDTVLLPRLLRASRRGWFFMPNYGRAQIELTDVRDASSAFVSADQNRNRAQGRAFNISGGQPRAVKDILSFLFSHMGLSIRLLAVPSGLAMTMAHLLEIVATLLPGYPEPPATRYTMMTLAFSQTFDLSAAYAVLGWSPQYSPEEAIASALSKNHSHA